MTHTPAKRGDVVALVRTETTTAADYSRTTTERVTLAKVTSITRDGIVKLAAYHDGGTAYRADIDGTLTRIMLAPASVIDVDAALAAYGTRRYPTAPDSTVVPPFDSVEEARTFLATFKRTEA